MIGTLALGDISKGGDQVELVGSIGALADGKRSGAVWGLGKEVGGSGGVCLVDLPEACWDNDSTGNGNSFQRHLVPVRCDGGKGESR